jgi:serine/threonine protein kinase
MFSLIQCFKLADFGFSKNIDDVTGTILGTDSFMSPEIFSGDSDNVYGFEVDMWAFGVLFF